MVSVAGAGVFPKPQKPRVIWVGVVAPDDLVVLQDEIEVTCSSLGFAREERPFSPHLTLGRVTQPINSTQADDIDKTLINCAIGNLGSTAVKEIHLFRSELTPSGAVYTRLFTVSLNEDY
jgi:RNA 2',3'-cyclic 3'-phosphodiesterase